MKKKKRDFVSKNKFCSSSTITMALESFEELLERDRQREKDGFERKIKIQKVILGPSNKVIITPYVEEEKLIHGDFEPKSNHGQDIAGHGDGKVGEIIGRKRPFYSTEGEEESGDKGYAGEGSGEEQGIESKMYELGKEFSEKFQLPNLKNKGKKVLADEYTYELTDRFKGTGQLLDKKETLKSIIKTNVQLGRIDKDNNDLSRVVVGPADKIYRILSKERVYKSQAVVFFVRDYSGSMAGEATKAILKQHFVIFSWLVVQYQRLVIPRFIVHDVAAKEIKTERYFSEIVSNGGTQIYSAYKKINEIVENENLSRDYNIYVFHGTDGEDFDDGRKVIPEIKKMLSYTNRFGVCIIKSGNKYHKSEFEQYVEKEGINNEKELFRMHVMTTEDIKNEEKIIESIKSLISQD